MDSKEILDGIEKLGKLMIEGIKHSYQEDRKIRYKQINKERRIKRRTYN